MTFHGSPPGGRRRPLSSEEALISSRRIGNIVGDEARITLNDKAFNDYSSRQVSRNTDITGGPVDNRFDRFTPSVDRFDLGLEGSVGDNGQNFMRDVFGVKKALFNAGGYEFAPGIEPVLAPNDRFKTAIRDFQAGNELKIDGQVLPGGPSIHMLGLKALGQEDGKPSGYDAAAFKQNTGRDPNLTLSGKPIFATPGKGGGTGPSGTQQAMNTATFPGGPPPFWPQVPEPTENVKRAFRKFLKAARDGFPNIPEKSEKPDIRTKPAIIYRYPDGRVYVAMSFQGKIQRSDAGPGKVQFQDLETELMIKVLRDSSKQPYPKLEDRRSFQERNAVGKESYVYGPVKEKNGKVSYVPLVDPSTRSFIGGKAKLLRAPGSKPIFLTLEQIDGMGLRKWHMVEK